MAAPSPLEQVHCSRRVHDRKGGRQARRGFNGEILARLCGGQGFTQDVMAICIEPKDTMTGELSFATQDHKAQCLNQW